MIKENTRKMASNKKVADIQDSSESDGDREIELRYNGGCEDRQEVEKRRNLRSQYRKLIHDLQGKDVEDEDGAITNDSSVEQTAEKFKEQLELVERLHSQLTHTREAALDSQVYSLIASNAKHRVQSLQSDLVSFNPEEFAEKLKSFFDVDRAAYPNSLPNQVWMDLGTNFPSTFKRTAPYHFFSGSFEPGEVQPKIVQRRPRVRRDESSQNPTIIQQIAPNDKNHEEKTTEEVEYVLQTLRNLFKRNSDQPLCYFQFVIDPFSFSRTVENIFHTSFLVKDGEAKVLYDDYELPVIMPVDKKGSGTEKYALAMGISVTEWKELKTALNITTAALGRKTDKRK